MTSLRESQRRTVTRTAVTLMLVAFAIFVYTLWHNVK